MVTQSTYYDARGHDVVLEEGYYQSSDYDLSDDLWLSLCIDENGAVTQTFLNRDAAIELARSILRNFNAPDKEDPLELAQAIIEESKVINRTDAPEEDAW